MEVMGEFKCPDSSFNNLGNADECKGTNAITSCLNSHVGEGDLATDETHNKETELEAAANKQPSKDEDKSTDGATKDGDCCMTRDKEKLVIDGEAVPRENCHNNSQTDSSGYLSHSADSEVSSLNSVHSECSPVVAEKTAPGLVNDGKVTVRKSGMFGSFSEEFQSKPLKTVLSSTKSMKNEVCKPERSTRRTIFCQLQKERDKTTSELTKFELSQTDNEADAVCRYSEILERINELVKPLQDHLFTRTSSQKSEEHSSTQTSPPVSSNKHNPLKCHRDLPEKCLIHSIPKRIRCLDCKVKQCSQCILTDGTCRDHKLAESPCISKQREKVKLLMALETTSCDLNQLELHTRNVESELENIGVKCLLRREEIQQEFTSFMDLLIQQKDMVLRLLDEETRQRKLYLESLLKKHQGLQQAEVTLSEEVTTLVQNRSRDYSLSSLQRLHTDCEKLSSTVKSFPLPQKPAVTSLLDNPFSLYREKSHFDRAVTRDTSTNGDIHFRRKTLFMKLADKLVLDHLIDVPTFPTSSHQIYTVELLKSPRTKLWQASVPSLQGLTLNCYTTYCFKRNESYLLRLRVCVYTEKSAMTVLEKEGRPTHMLILPEDDCPMDMTDPIPDKENFVRRIFYSYEELRYLSLSTRMPLFRSEHKRMRVVKKGHKKKN